ncbi:hypothetical protein NP493_2518g00003 [Ridgeia piscesae]|uniref:Uncharacterized protein n=1 Tax=Ridgeia piscesae TaxID=27915 RepID=A0AAD9JEJ0_RIDPI|nr:hypothetical protein NP493_2518g00003 [Ridgeia piscesae]
MDNAIDMETKMDKATDNKTKMDNAIDTELKQTKPLGKADPGRGRSGRVQERKNHLEGGKKQRLSKHGDGEKKRRRAEESKKDHLSKKQRIYDFDAEVNDNDGYSTPHVLKPTKIKITTAGGRMQVQPSVAVTPPAATASKTPPLASTKYSSASSGSTIKLVKSVHGGGDRVSPKLSHSGTSGGGSGRPNSRMKSESGGGTGRERVDSKLQRTPTIKLKPINMPHNASAATTTSTKSSHSPATPSSGKSSTAPVVIASTQSSSAGHAKKPSQVKTRKNSLSGKIGFGGVLRGGWGPKTSKTRKRNPKESFRSSQGGVKGSKLTFETKLNQKSLEHRRTSDLSRTEAAPSQVPQRLCHGLRRPTRLKLSRRVSMAPPRRRRPVPRPSCRGSSHDGDRQRKPKVDSTAADADQPKRHFLDVVSKISSSPGDAATESRTAASNGGAGTTDGSGWTASLAKPTPAHSHGRSHSIHCTDTTTRSNSVTNPKSFRTDGATVATPSGRNTPTSRGAGAVNNVAESDGGVLDLSAVARTSDTPAAATETKPTTVTSTARKCENAATPSRDACPAASAADNSHSENKENTKFESTSYDGVFKAPTPKSAKSDERSRDAAPTRARAVASPHSDVSSPEDGLVIDCPGYSARSPATKQHTTNSTRSPQSPAVVQPCSPAAVTDTIAWSPGAKSAQSPASRKSAKLSPVKSPMSQRNLVGSPPSNSPCEIDDDLMDAALML